MSKTRTEKKERERIKKISRAMKGKNNPMYGKKGKSHPKFGKKHTKESRKRMAISKLGEKNPNYGKSTWSTGLTKKTDKRLKNLGKKTSKTLKKLYDSKKLINPNKGKHMWKNKKHPKGMLGKNHTKKTRKKMSKTKKSLYENGKLIHPKGMLGKHLSKKSKKKISLSKIGRKNPAWFGGISFEPYGLDFNRKLRNKIKKKYNYICQVTKEKIIKNTLKKHLCIHHISYNKKDNREINLIPLSSRIHRKTNFNRDYWFSYFCYMKHLQPGKLI